jgi:hypothetical protein
MGDINDVIRRAIVFALVSAKPDKAINRQIRPVRSITVILFLLKAFALCVI